MTWLVVLLVGLASLSLALTVVFYACVPCVMRRVTSTGPLPPISILKPVKGAEPELYDNLASIARQDYPEFELCIGAEDIADPALAVAQRLRKEHPHVPITIVAGGRSMGLNPKVNNLNNLCRAARHDWILLSDADVRADDQYLRALTSELSDPAVGLVSSLIIGRSATRLGARLENLQLNTFVVGTVCAADVLARHACVIGKSVLVQRSKLEQLGGWRAVADVLAEDYALGQLFARAGHRVALSPHAVQSHNERRSVAEFMARHVRWCQMRRRMAPGLYAGEPLLNPTLWFAALGCAVLAQAGSRAAGSDSWNAALAAFVVFGLLSKALIDATLIRCLRGQWAGPADLLLSPVKDLLIGGVWLMGAFRRQVEWRGNRFRIDTGSLLRPLSDARQEVTAPQRS